MGGLGPNPAAQVLALTGVWATQALGVVLLLTPLQRGFAWTGLASIRRLLGVSAFFYSALHTAAYVSFDQGFDWVAILRDGLERPMIAVGWGATIIMAAMALTSNQWSMQRLGGRRWKQLHRWVYLAALLVWLHLYWVHSGKQTWEEVIWYGLWFGAAVALRLVKGRNAP